MAQKLSKNIDDLRTKYRPKRFSDVIGQDAVVNDLRRMAAARTPNNKVLLFEGTRGTGKTTLARIVAAALNCENPSEDGEPCGQCTVCQAAFAGARDISVAHEVNSAELNVQKARELINGLHMRTNSRWRVVILDEAHLLNQAASEFLKVFEEPPAGVLFAMCTTHAHKLPEALLSRAAQFKLQDVVHSELTKYIAWMAEQEDFELSHEDAELIAATGSGSVRYAITNLEAFIGGRPMNDPFVGIEITEALIDGDLGKALLAIKRAQATGSMDAREVGESLRNFYGDAIVARYSPETMDLLMRNKSERYVNAVEDAADNDDITLDELTSGISIMSNAVANMPVGNSAAAQLESAVVRILEPDDERFFQRLTNKILDAIEDNDGQLVVNHITKNITRNVVTGTAQTVDDGHVAGDDESAQTSGDGEEDPWNGAESVEERWPVEDDEDEREKREEADRASEDDELEDDDEEEVEDEEDASDFDEDDSELDDEESDEDEESEEDDNVDDSDEEEEFDESGDEDDEDDEESDDEDDAEVGDDDDDVDEDAVAIHEEMKKIAAKRKSKRVLSIVESIVSIGFMEDDDGEFFEIILPGGITSSKMISLIQTIAEQAMKSQDIDVDIDIDVDEEEE